MASTLSSPGSVSNNHAAADAALRTASPCLFMDLLRKEGFSYSFDPQACASCSGRCCRGESGNIWVNRGEIDLIVAYLGTNLVDFMASSLRQADGRQSLRERWSGEEAVCLFFDVQAGTCRIYPVRPTQCREFPFWEHFRGCPEELAKECPGVRLERVGSHQLSVG